MEMHRWVHVHMEARGWHLPLLPYFLKRGLSLNLELIGLVMLDNY